MISDVNRVTWLFLKDRVQLNILSEDFPSLLSSELKNNYFVKSKDPYIPIPCFRWLKLRQEQKKRTLAENSLWNEPYYSLSTANKQRHQKTNWIAFQKSNLKCSQ